MKRPLSYALALVIAASLGVATFTTMTSHNKAVAAGPMATKGDIVDVATGPGMAKVTTLVKAVQAAGLVEALKGKGPFTVFAPTNEAFAKLPPETLESLLKPENKDKLKAILLYHVHAGEAVGSTKLEAGKLSTLNGKEVTIKIEGPTIMVNDATVTKTDVMATNGVIHWIDTVILP
ncbi:MAG TPA: fasciclin domain-containing protein [Phycisphaerae bacterium]|nr:fasciclin domain-containing protein [Phycisphaerae bacterium]